MAALDGLRGLVIISVVLNHAGGQLWSRGAVYDVPVLRGFLGAGAVVVFFVVGAFIVTHNLLREREKGSLDPLRFYLRRLIRLGVQLVPLCIAMLVLNDVERSFHSSGKVMAGNIGHVLTYTLNTWGSTRLLELRPELGHLWYLSVQQQCYLLLPLAILFLARWRFVFIVVLCGLMVAVYWWRQETLESDGWIVASQLTTTRADGLLWGVVLAVALPWCRRLGGWRHVLWASALLLLALKLLLAELDEEAYLGPWSIFFTLTSGVVVLAIWLVDKPTRTSRLLSLEPLQRLGRASLAIFIWHLPIIFVVSRHTLDWHWGTRTALALAILAGTVLAMERWVEDPVRRFLATSPLVRVRQT